MSPTPIKPTIKQENTMIFIVLPQIPETYFLNKTSRQKFFKVQSTTPQWINLPIVTSRNLGDQEAKLGVYSEGYTGT
jgi:hypothetical protein